MSLSLRLSTPCPSAVSLPSQRRKGEKGTASGKLCLQPLSCPEVPELLPALQAALPLPGSVNTCSWWSPVIVPLFLWRNWAAADGWTTNAHGAFCCFWRWWSTAWTALLHQCQPIHCLPSCAAWLLLHGDCNKPKFHLKNCSYIHSTSKAKTVTREVSKLQIHYHLTHLAREPQRRSNPLCLWAFRTPWKDSCLPSLRGGYLT